MRDSSLPRLLIFFFFGLSYILSLKITFEWLVYAQYMIAFRIYEVWGKWEKWQTEIIVASSSLLW